MFFIVRCNQCGLTWRNPIPDQESLSGLYAAPYYNVANHSPSLVYQVGIADFEEADKERRHQTAHNEVRNWRKLGFSPRTSRGEPKKLLEIGGGKGYLQLAADEYGWNTVGIEISPHAIQTAKGKGLVVFPVTLDEVCSKTAPYRNHFDAIVFFDFLEHVANPGELVRMLKDLLKENGHIILRVPRTDDFPRIHLIDHIWYFSRKTIVRLLEKEGYRITHPHDNGAFESANGDILENVTIFAALSG